VDLVGFIVRITFIS